MNAALAAGGIAVVAGAAGLLAGRRSLRGSMRRLADEHRQASVSLDRRLTTSLEDRAIRDRILGSMQDGVLLFDGGWRTVFANEALVRHLGARPEALAQVFPGELRGSIAATAETLATRTVELEVGSPPRWLRATVTPAGADGSVLVVVTDITESRRVDAVRRDFVANASHELKTPVASIRAAAETIKDAAADDPPAVRRFAWQLERDALRLSRIVSDLLDLSRLESGSDLDGRVHMGEVVAEEVERIRGDAEAAGVELRVDAHGVPSIRGSARDLALLARNLIDNAVSYTPSSGTVTVTVASEADRIVMRVTDTGEGIPGRDLARIFERFYRVDRARSRETGGTGLGLAIVKHIAENHGGTVTVESELGRGSTFEVRLPIAAP